MLIDDRPLIEELLSGLPCRDDPEHFRVAFKSSPVPSRSEPSISLVELHDDIGLPDPCPTVPAMAEVARRHRRLNVFDLEAVPSLGCLGPRCLSEAGTEGVLPAVLGAEGIAWRTINIG